MRTPVEPISNLSTVFTSRFLRATCALIILTANILSPWPPTFAVDVPIPTKHTLPGSYTSPNAISTSDLDADGDLDVLGADYDGDSIVWWESDGTPGDEGWTTHVVTDTLTEARTVQSADVNGDGDLDVISTAQNQVIWWESDGTPGDGGWITHVVTDTSMDSDLYDTYWADPADIDGDGDVDIFGAIGSITRDVVWWENTAGDGSAWSVHTVTDTIGFPAKVYAVDVDSDGDLDALGVGIQPGLIAWWENTAGDGTAWEDHIVDDGVSWPKSVYSADVDGDGDIDILGADYGSDDVIWWENTAGDGSTWTEHLVDDFFESAEAVYAADMDRDGDVDILGGAYDGDDVTWWENTAGDGSAWTERVVDGDFYRPRMVLAADVDGDGDPDVLAGGGNSPGEFAWWENVSIHRSATFPIKETIDDQFDGAWDVYPADIDGDGDLDVLGGGTNHTSPSDGWISWWRNNDGSGSNWSEFVVLTDGFDGAVSVRAADLDRDGDLDIIGAAWQDDDVAWWENTAGTGSSWSRHNLNTDFTGAYCVRAADIDGDGLLDVVGSGAENNTIAWWENNGTTSGWAQHTVHNIHAHNARAISLGDVDRDGDVDVVGAVMGYNYIAWWENDGSGGGWAVNEVSGGWHSFSGAQSLYTTDVDGDGDLDVIGTRNNPDSTSDIVWFENDGSGGGWTWHTVATSFNGADGVYATDFDMDGDMDILGAHPDAHWWENTAGDGSSWTEHVIDDNFSGRNAYAADIDDDGDQDIVGADYSFNDVVWWRNRGGQFALETTDLAPAEIVSGESDEVLRIKMIHRGLPGEQDEELVTLELLFEETAGDPLTTAEANALIENVHIYLDDGSQTFDPVWDTEILTVTTLSLTAEGVQTITFADGDANVQVLQVLPKTFFVVPELADDAYLQTPDQFRITHLTESTSTAEDRDYDTPLLLEYAANVSSGIVVADAEADLDIDKTSQPVPAVPGATITYTIVVENLGPSAVAGATVADTFPGTIDAPTWTCTGSAGTSCTASGSGNINDSVDLPDGGTITYTVVGTLDPAVTADVTNSASASNPSGVPDPNSDNNSSTDVNTPEPQADLTIDKVSSPSPMVPGAAISYTIVVHNSGPSDAPSAVVADTFPDEITAVTWVCVSSGGALCDSGAGSGDINATDDLPAGGTITYTVSGLLPAWVTATVVNTATVTVPTGVVELDELDNTDVDSNDPAPFADLSVSKIGSPEVVLPGDAITYTIVVSNTGPSDAPAATVSDPMPAELSAVTWICASTGGASCTATGSDDIADTVDLPAGGLITYTVFGTLTSNRVENVVTVTAPIGVADPQGNNSVTAINGSFTVYLPLVLR